MRIVPTLFKAWEAWVAAGKSAGAAPIRQHFDSVTFDLDGTLVDTLGDIAAACRLALAEAGFPARSDEEVRGFLGKKSDVLIRRCLSDGRAPVSEDIVQSVKARYWHHYFIVTGANTLVIPGAHECLALWKETGLKLAVVTNKPERIAKALIPRLGMGEIFDLIIAGSPKRPAKPNPEPILRACAALQTEPRRNLHIGDSRKDQLAAQAAGCSFIQTSGEAFTISPAFVAGTHFSNFN